MSETPKQPVAVALLYEKTQVPRVIATGRGEIGQAIIDTARAHGVPLKEDPLLAEALATIQLEDQIPPELYKAVAAVIGFIVKASKRPQATSLP